MAGMATGEGSDPGNIHYIHYIQHSRLPYRLWPIDALRPSRFTRLMLSIGSREAGYSIFSGSFFSIHST